MAGRGVEPARAPSLPAHGRKRPRKSVIVHSAHRSLRLGISTADVLKKEILLTLAWLGILPQSPAAWLLLISFRWSHGKHRTTLYKMLSNLFERRTVSWKCL